MREKQLRLQREIKEKQNSESPTLQETGNDSKGKTDIEKKAPRKNITPIVFDDAAPKPKKHSFKPVVFDIQEDSKSSSQDSVKVTSSNKRSISPVKFGDSNKTKSINRSPKKQKTSVKPVVFSNRNSEQSESQSSAKSSRQLSPVVFEQFELDFPPDLSELEDVPSVKTNLKTSTLTGKKEVAKKPAVQNKEVTTKKDSQEAVKAKSSPVLNVGKSQEPVSSAVVKHSSASPGSDPVTPKTATSTTISLQRSVSKDGSAQKTPAIRRRSSGSKTGSNAAPETPKLKTDSTAR